MLNEFLSPALAIALSAYTVGVASPGPSNMAIMATAMSQGRRQALALAAGVVCGSLVWGLAAALGLSELMRSYSGALVALKVLGGLYLLYLSARAARAALTPHQHLSGPTHCISGGSKWRAFTGGLAMHITNPKAIFVWLSIVALALPSAASRDHALGVVASCAVIGALVFFGYALAFSTEVARSIYARAHRWFNATLSAVFAVAGVRLLLSRSAT
ncbi:MAG: LysE family translocator [Rhodocyclaceae bacterium]